jgi:O-acetylhomoserine (thiol)-lyase
MTDLANARPETLALHAGWRADPSTGSVAVPIHQTTSYQFHDTTHAANLFGLKELGNIYTRLGNPTTDVLEKRIAALEGGVAALPSHPDRRHRLMPCSISRAQATTSFPRPTSMAAPGTCLPTRSRIWASRSASSTRPTPKRSVARPTSAPAPIMPKRCPIQTGRFSHRGSRAIGREAGIPLIVDNTAAPLLVRPFDHGAAIVVYSSTKYIGGHGTSIGGLIVDSGNFDWEAFPERQPLLNTPDPSYHGAVWARDIKPLGPIAYIIRARVILLRDMGAALSPSTRSS